MTLPFLPIAMHLVLAAQATEGVQPTSEPDQAPVAAKTALWAGILSVTGSRRVPLLGKVEFQTDTYVIAHATPVTEDKWALTQTTCEIDFPKTLGAEISVDKAALVDIPPGNLEWARSASGEWTASSWKSGWDEKDHDKDGEPGVSFHVAAPFCGGRLHVASDARQTARGEDVEGHILQGTVRVYVEQRILGAKGPCLNLMARDTNEWMDGRIAYIAVPASATCATNTSWPSLPDP
jgi:hypothetical protein